MGYAQASAVVVKRAIELYLQGKSFKQIARMVKYDHSTVWYWSKRWKKTGSYGERVDFTSDNEAFVGEYMREHNFKPLVDAEDF